MGDMTNLPIRKSIRLKSYDYSGAGYYFVTICTKNQVPLFGSIVDGEMHLSGHGKIAETELLSIPSHYYDIKIDKYIIMPNHIHIIIIVGAALAQPAYGADAGTKETGRASAPPTIGNVVRGYKAGVSRKIGSPVWQRNYHEHVIRNEVSHLRIWEYIDGNPVTWIDDRYYTH